MSGIEASAEIQVAARAVADENKKLRALLNQQGVSNNAIEANLRNDSTLGQGVSGAKAGNAVQVLEQLLATKKAFPCDTNYASGSVNSQREESRDSSVSIIQSGWSDTPNQMSHEGFSMSGAYQQQELDQFITPRTSASRTPSVNHGRTQSTPLQARSRLNYASTTTPASSSPSCSHDQVATQIMYDFDAQMYQHNNHHNSLADFNQIQSHNQLAQAHLSSVNGYHPVVTSNTNSCLYATDMIASMAGGDPDCVRQELCGGNRNGGDCQVDNHLIFRTMDQYTEARLQDRGHQI